MPTVENRAIHAHSRQADRFSERYEAMLRDPYGDCFGYSRMRLGELLDGYLEGAPGPSVLDVGCGTGHHLALLGERGFEAVGVDGSPEMLAHAQRLNPDAELHRSDVASLPFQDARFDAVLCLEVIRYLADPGPCLRELFRVTKPGGLVLMTATPLLNLNGYAIVNRLAPHLPVRLTQLRQFFSTSRGLRRRLDASGFTDIRVRGVYWGPINWIERLAPGRLPGFLRRWERIDRALADRRLIRETSNMFLASARRV
jgi:ubiquinone/menaquinone biosynthesis C-methylase UbiE